MKSLKLTAMAVTLAASFASASAYAQQKIGVVNVQQVFQSLPQAATVQQTINASLKDEIAVVQRLRDDLEYLLDKKERETVTMSDADIQKLDEQIQSTNEEYVAKAQPLQQEIQRRTNQERDKLLAMIQQGINKVAEAESYDIVLNAGAAAYVKSPDDLSKKVVDELVKTAN